VVVSAIFQSVLLPWKSNGSRGRGGRILNGTKNQESDGRWDRRERFRLGESGDDASLTHHPLVLMLRRGWRGDPQLEQGWMGRVGSGHGEGDEGIQDQLCASEDGYPTSKRVLPTS
jgi:hypothetical protein